MHQNSPRLIADTLRARISNDPSYEPGSVHALAKEFRVRRATVLQAVRALANEGLLTSRQRAGTSRADRQSDAPGMLSARIKTEIQEGRWRLGERLPKFDHFISHYQVSRTTVTLALERLSREMLIYKRGKSWLVGQAPKPGPMAGISGAGPLSLLVFSAAQANIYGNGFLSPFLESLHAELAQKGASIRTGFMAVDTTTGSAALPNQGIAAIAKSIREWGDLYQGAVVLDQYAGAEAMREWADVLGARGKKPVVYFDHTGEHESFTRKELQCGAGFYRLYLDEKSAVQLAAERLAALGHRTVGVLPVPHDNHPWVRRRIALLKRTVARDASRLSIIDAVHTEPFWTISPASNPADTAGFQEKLFAAIRRGKKHNSGIRSVPSAAEILRATPSLGSLIRKGATAIVGLNDWMAYLYLLWCIAAGIDVPGELSMISFDNSRDLRQFPLSSIDFGFGRLGYLAARILCGARPDDPGGAGAIPGICTLADRGSLGPAHLEGIARGRTKAGNIALPCRDFSGHHSPGRGDSHEVYPGGLQRQDNARLV